MTGTERVLVDTHVTAAPDEVWRALRDPERAHHWFGWDYPGLAAEIEEIFVGQATVDDDARTVAWADGDAFRLDPADDGTTRLQVVRRVSSADVHDPIDEGWITFAQQLRFWLERHPGEPRRTVSATGVDLGSDDAPLLTRLGLRPFGSEPVGSRYELPGPDGAAVTGEVYFQTDLQLGLSIAEERDALLVVARTPPAAAPPHGQAMFVLSTYGLDDDAFADVERRWSAWWSPAG